MATTLQSVLEGATAGVVGSLLFGLLLIGRDWLKFKRFKRKLSRILRATGCGAGIRGMTTNIRNPTGFEFVVREVALVTDKAVYMFNATGQVRSSWEEQPPQFNAAQLEKLKKGEAVEAGPPKMEYRRWEVGVGEGGFVAVAPFTSHEFLLPAELIAGTKAKPLYLRVIIEAKNWLGERELMQENTAEEFAIRSLDGALQSFRPGIGLDGLNATRVMFRLPPIK
jgi:hypothetical protein